MKQDKEREIFDECRRVWGVPSQVIMLAEESSELSVASLKMLRTYTSKDAEMKRTEKLAEECADVLLMVDEIAYYYDLGFSISEFREEKLERLKKRLGME